VKIGEITSLWILDPFDITSVPFNLVKACLAQPRDEVLVTWFADEIYRFCGDKTKHRALDGHFGTSTWRRALEIHGEGARKEMLLQAYRESIETLPQVVTGDFSISSKNEAARYSIVFATHSVAGLECFTQMSWRMDKYRGKRINEFRGLDQPGLFDDQPQVNPLRAKLETLAGESHSMTDLTQIALRLGFKQTHLRQVLTDMAADGMAAHESPLDYTRSPWPDDSIIRFYALDA
jgi:hypothetical protein